MAQGLDIKAFTDGVLGAWWQSALVGIVVVSALFGLIGTFWGLVKTIRARQTVSGWRVIGLMPVWTMADIIIGEEGSPRAFITDHCAVARPVQKKHHLLRCARQNPPQTHILRRLSRNTA